MKGLYDLGVVWVISVFLDSMCLFFRVDLVFLGNFFEVIVCVCLNMYVDVGEVLVGLLCFGCVII